MNLSSHFNRYEIDAELAYRRAQYRNDYNSRGRLKGRSRLPALPTLPALSWLRFRRPSLSS